MVPDPYKALNLPHSASQDDIKKSYRELARRFHPDRQPLQSDSTATQKFSDISAAYALLTDPKRKADYDHIYKYGGYDDDDDDEHGSSVRRCRDEADDTSNQRRSQQVGVGYSCTDPFAFVWSQGRVHSTTTVAGIQVPSRLQMTRPGSSLRFAYSSGQFIKSRTNDGTYQCLRRTTQFANGKKYHKTERFLVHPDGRAEVLDSGDDAAGCEESAVTEPVGPEAPWYMHAWYDIKDRLTMCYNPCTAVAAQ